MADHRAPRRVRGHGEEALPRGAPQRAVERSDQPPRAHNHHHLSRQLAQETVDVGGVDGGVTVTQRPPVGLAHTLPDGRARRRRAERQRHGERFEILGAHPELPSSVARLVVVPGQERHPQPGVGAAVLVAKGAVHAVV
eukprot:scaffold297_cov108-Isochrysis_galbana.AAC.6